MKRAAVLVVLLAAVVPACGQKGPPRPPLRIVPAAPAEVEAVRRGSDVHLRFAVPKTTAGGEGRLDIERLEVYAITVAPGTPDPPNRDLLTKRFLVGTIPVKPQPGPNEEPPPSQRAPQGQPPAAVADDRPAPGEPATFVETLTPEALTPVTLERPRQSAPAPLTTAAWMKEPVKAPYATRRYVVRGVTRGGRAGAPSAPVVVPLVEPPPPPAVPTVSFTETAVTISWTAPELPPVTPEAPGPRAMLKLALAVQTTVALAGAAPHAPPTTALLAGAVDPAALPPVIGFKVYSREGTPLTPTPIAATTFERSGVEFGREECFVVRTVQTIGVASIESEPADTACVTPVDTFAPQAPQRLSAVAGTGVINLIWDANTEADLAGYLVLRGEAPGDTLQPLTPEPIRETSYRDGTVKAGVRYVYAVVAVDRASPPNRSGQSNRVEETAR